MALLVNGGPGAGWFECTTSATEFGNFPSLELAERFDAWCRQELGRDPRALGAAYPQVEKLWLAQNREKA